MFSVWVQVADVAARLANGEEYGGCLEGWLGWRKEKRTQYLFEGDGFVSLETQRAV